MHRLRAPAAVLVLALLIVTLGGCSHEPEPPDYSDLTRLAEKLPAAVGTPPGVAVVDARGGSIGDAGYVEIEVTLAPGATGDQVVDLVQRRLPQAMDRLGGAAGAPLVVRKTDGDELRPEWGPYADEVAEAVRIRAWVAAAAALPEPIVVEDSAASVELGDRPAGAVAGTYRTLAGLDALRGGSTPDIDWTVTRSSGVSLRLAADHALPSAEQLAAWRGLVATPQRPAGQFRPVSLDVSTWGVGLKCTYTVTASPPVPVDELTVARFGAALLPVLAAQARLCSRGAYDVEVVADPAAPPVPLLQGEWRPALRAAVRALRGSATLGR